MAVHRVLQADRRRAFANLDKAAQAARVRRRGAALPFLVRRAAELAATAKVPLQFHTGVGGEDVYPPPRRPGPALAAAA